MEGGQGGSCTWGRKVLGKGNGQCKGPEAGRCLVCLQISRETLWLEEVIS